MTIFTKINTFLNVLIPDDSAATSSELATRLNASIKEKESGQITKPTWTIKVQVGFFCAIYTKMEKRERGVKGWMIVRF